MIASVRGVIESKGADRLVVQVGGVGIRVLVPGNVVADSGDVGEAVHLQTHLQVREDSLTLYGFGSAEQLRLFELLISVTGVGPGHALSILSTGSPEAVEAAIATENADYFSRVPRVGKKLAGRIVLELKNRVRQVEDGEYAVIPVGPVDSDVVAALVNWGYTAGEAHAAARSIPANENLPLEEKIRRALAYFGGVPG